MVAIRLVSIKPKSPLVKSPRQAVEKELKRWTAETIRQARKYPPARTDYRRTGTLGRGWEGEFAAPSGRLEARVTNSVDYAPYVQGPEGVQRDVFAGYDWTRIDEAGAAAWDKVEPAIRHALGDVMTD